MGEIDEVIAVLDRPVQRMEGETLAYALLRFASGKIGVLEAFLGETIDAPNEDFRVTGTEGIIVVTKGHGGRMLLYNGEHPQGLEVLPTGQTRAGAFGLELADFVQAMLQGTPLTAGPEVSLGELRTTLAMYRSAESRQWEKGWDQRKD
jgi:predicted dehydrogenase